jgi:RNA polymerase sigma-70 factor (ECF subfamily)
VERRELEANLRRRVLAGDDSAWEELYAESFEAVWVAVSRRVGPDRHRIEDVVGETWLVAVRRIASFDPAAGSFLGWLHGIADLVHRNARRSWARREGRSRQPLAAAEALPVAGGGRAAAEEARELVEASFASIPERYREVLREKYLDELPVEEIARRRESTPKAVESLLSRARGAFRESYRHLAGGPRRIGSERGAVE